LAIGSENTLEVKVVQGVVTVLFGVIGWVVQIFTQIGFIRTIKSCDDGAPGKKVVDIYKESARYFWPLVWTNILLCLVLFGSALFLIIPAIFLAIQLSYYMYAVVLEDKRGLNGLLTSFHYVDGYWGQVFWRGLGLGLVFLAIFFCLAILAVILVVAAGGSLAAVSVWLHTMDGVSSILFGILAGFLGTCVVSPITYHYSYSVYKSLKSFKPEINFGAPETKTRRKWFVALSVIGVVLFVFLIGSPILILLKTLAQAR
jgi:hypothetical protein